MATHLFFMLDKLVWWCHQGNGNNSNLDRSHENVIWNIWYWKRYKTKFLDAGMQDVSTRIKVLLISTDEK